MLTLDTKVSSLGRIGRAASKYLRNIDIETVKDLIFYYPARYDDLSRVVPIKDARPWTTATLKCRIDLIENRRSAKKHRLLTEAIVSDDTGKMKVVWFNQPFIPKILKSGDYIYLSGKVDADYFGPQMAGPVYEKISSGAPTHTARIVPVYPLTEHLSQKQIRFLIKSTLGASSRASDQLPAEIRKKFNLLGLSAALREAHFPTSLELANSARRRLKFDELFTLALRNELTRLNLKKSFAPKITFREAETRAFVNSLPYKLTEAQRKSAWEILKDMAGVSPMNRLLDGDVGSGKTVVAAIAMLQAALSGYQSAIMAPTEILARQHFNTLAGIFCGFGIKVCLLTHSFSFLEKPACPANGGEKIIKKKLLEEIGAGDVRVVVGTHALVQEDVKFKNLGLAVVDEQHRFGVAQRAALKKKADFPADWSPHLLSMTATPIPRTLALSAYGDLDISIINELPKERLPVITRVIRPEDRKSVYEFAREEIKKGRQMFVICPLIDVSDKLGVKSVIEEHKKLQEIFTEFSIGLLHGKMKAVEKEAVMADFLANRMQILVSTSVVEVGVDVRNASIMLIEGSERFGLAQLHQFRGRIGRGEHQSYCFAALQNAGSEAGERLKVFAHCRNGFELAEKDLEFRGQGDILGTRQSGQIDFQIASLADVPILKEAREAAKMVVAKSPDLSAFPPLKEKMEDLEKKIHLE